MKGSQALGGRYSFNLYLHFLFYWNILTGINTVYFKPNMGEWRTCLTQSWVSSICAGCKHTAALHQDNLNTRHGCNQFRRWKRHFVKYSILYKNIMQLFDHTSVLYLILCCSLLLNRQAFRIYFGLLLKFIITMATSGVVLIMGSSQALLWGKIWGGSDVVQQRAKGRDT